MTPEETKAFLRARCHEDGDCLLWDGATDSAGVPQTRLPGERKVYPARRLMLEAMGKCIDGLLATSRCGNPRCLAEEHVVAWSRKRLQKRTGKKLADNPLHSAKLARAAQRRSRITMEDVERARAEGLDWQALSQRHNLCESAARDILAGRAWKDYRNPFTSLLAANDNRRASVA